MTPQTEQELMHMVIQLKEDGSVTKEDLIDLVVMIIVQDDVVMPLEDMINDRGMNDEL